MASSSEARKRSGPIRVEKMKARKRQKLDDPLPSSRSASNREKKNFKVENLQWKEVSIPEQMESYEGFYGLEEVDDVDIVRDESTGQTSFQALSDVLEAKVNDAPVGESKHKIHGQKPQVYGSREAKDSGEWSGFDDEGYKEEDGCDDESPRGQSQKTHYPPKPGKGILRSPKQEDTKISLDTPKHTVEPSAPSNPSNQSNKLPQSEDASLYDTLHSSAASGEEIDTGAWNELPLSPEILLGISALKFSSPTPIQSSAIPSIISGRDVIGKAPTGSGKTLAFGVPILERWLAAQNHIARKQKNNEGGKTPTALIIEPTRELARQIGDHLTALCSNLPSESPSIATLTGGLSIQKQRRLLSNADIIVATPGRLWEVISEGHGVLARLQAVSILVVDEADRLLNQGHFKELEEVLSALDRGATDDSTQAPQKPNPHTRQTLIFSATFDAQLSRKLSSSHSHPTSSDSRMDILLSKLHLKPTSSPHSRPPPNFIDVNPTKQMAPNLTEAMLETPTGTDKDLYLYTVLLMHPSPRTLVFVNSIAAARRLVPLLANLDVQAHALHSQMPQKARLRAIERFSAAQHPGASGKSACQVLVATDVAARGLDIPAVPLVLHYHLPRTADMYIHRSGRTARASASGASVLLCAPQEAAGTRRMLARVHAKDETAGGSAKRKDMRSLHPSPKTVTRLKPRVQLAKTLADARLAREKRNINKEADRAAREELESSAEEEDENSDEESRAEERGGKKGRKRRQREEEVLKLTKAELRGMRARLRELLAERVNTGVSARYIAGGGVDVSSLVGEWERGGGVWLGGAPELGL